MLPDLNHKPFDNKADPLLVDSD